jgi:hypothetical protein
MGGQGKQNKCQWTSADGSHNQMPCRSPALELGHTQHLDMPRPGLYKTRHAAMYCVSTVLHSSILMLTDVPPPGSFHTLHMLPAVQPAQSLAVPAGPAGCSCPPGFCAAAQGCTRHHCTGLQRATHKLTCIALQATIHGNAVSCQSAQSWKLQAPTARASAPCI